MVSRSVFLMMASVLCTVGYAALTLPRQVHLSHVTGYLSESGSSDYIMSDKIEAKWDLDRGCFGFLRYNYLGINDWKEFVLCGSRYTEYTSKEKVCWSTESSETGPDALGNWFSGFADELDGRVRDPIFGKGSYNVFKHNSEEAQMYVNSETGSVEFIKFGDMMADGADYVLHIKEGISNSTEPIEFQFEKAPCTHRTEAKPAFSFGANKKT
jgi:hypothetical protein